MSWKIYSLGTASSASSVGRKAANKLTEIGYTATSTNSSSMQGVISIDVGGTTYDVPLWVESTSFSYYLCVNDETNDILVTTASNKESGSNMLYYMVCAALLSGTNAETGESGLFYITKAYQAAYGFTNLWYGTFDDSSVMLLHRAIFAKDSYGNPIAPFVSTLYWGSKKLSVGATFTIGADSFVCLGGYLYAKL